MATQSLTNVRDCDVDFVAQRANGESVDDFFASYDARTVPTTQSPVGSPIVSAISKPIAPRAFRIDFELIGILICFAMAAWFAFVPSKSTKTVIASSTAPAKLPVRQVKHIQPSMQKTAPKMIAIRTKIEDMKVGMRSIGTNPLRGQVDSSLPDPDPETWRHLVLRMTKASGLFLHINLLRELTWIESSGANEGGTFFLDLPEMGAVGNAFVVSIGPCPKIQPGPGNVVTGTFAHEADSNTRLVRVELENGDVIDGVTDNHPFYSVRHKDYLPIGEMREGDLVKVQSGVAAIAKLDPIPIVPGEMLYNLEIHREHVYQVGESAILVHNTCIISVGGGAQLNHLNPHHVAQIRQFAEAHNVRVTLVGSRASGTFSIISDFDYLIQGGNARVRSLARSQLPRGPRSLDHGGIGIDIWNEANFPLDTTRAHIIFDALLP